MKTKLAALFAVVTVAIVGAIQLPERHGSRSTNVTPQSPLNQNDGGTVEAERPESRDKTSRGEIAHPGKSAAGEDVAEQAPGTFAADSFARRSISVAEQLCENSATYSDLLDIAVELIAMSSPDEWEIDFKGGINYEVAGLPEGFSGSVRIAGTAEQGTAPLTMELIMPSRRAILGTTELAPELKLNLSVNGGDAEAGTGSFAALAEYSIVPGPGIDSSLSGTQPIPYGGFISIGSEGASFTGLVLEPAEAGGADGTRMRMLDPTQRFDALRDGRFEHLAAMEEAIRGQ